jgi:glucuronate isomerase
MKQFMDNDFLLSTSTASKLYHEVAAGEPIFDYHCHLNPQEIADNRRFSDLAAIWLSGDHYKWRVMRANGVSEKFVTGNGEPYDKFLAWADTVPRLIGNPLYHWTHLELRRFFDIDEPLNLQSAPEIWKAANERLANDPALTVIGIFKKFNVFAVGTTDDPADNLEWHQKIYTQSTIGTKVLPSFRPDQILHIEKPGFVEYITKLGTAAGKNIQNLDDLLDAILSRIDFFHNNGCRISDHSIEYIPYRTASSDPYPAHPTEVNFNLWEQEIDEIFSRELNGETLNRQEIEAWTTFIFNFLGEEYAKRNWVMQIHSSVIRNNNSAAFALLGPDTGFDAVNDFPLVAEKLSRLLDLLHFRGKLPKMILYSLNPKDLYIMATHMGNFQGETDPAKHSIPGKMQFGSAWWFLDHIDGMETQMRLLANTGLLSRFIGMITDSRSFLSYPRHEYFRRILCNILGTWVENGEIPNDFGLLGGMVRDIAFRNARQYFEVG